MGGGRVRELVVRADASSRIGLGHVMRTLAIAQAWMRRGRVTYACSELPESVRARLEREGIDVEDAPAGSAPGSAEDRAWLGSLASARRAAVVIDGYHLGPSYAEGLEVERCLLLDDEGIEAPIASDILNANLHGVASMYPRAGGALLLGPRFALIRREVRERPQGTPRPALETVVVSFGGADPERLTAAAVRLLSETLASAGADARIVAVLGPAARSNAHEVAAAAPSVEVLVDPPDLPDRFAQADLAIVAAGGTVWELAYLGVPMALVSTAPNQIPTCRAAREHGMGVVIGAASDVRTGAAAEALSRPLIDPELRVSVARRAQALIDGHGAARVVEHLLRA